MYLTSEVPTHIACLALLDHVSATPFFGLFSISFKHLCHPCNDFKTSIFVQTSKLFNTIIVFDLHDENSALLMIAELSMFQLYPA